MTKRSKVVARVVPEKPAKAERGDCAKAVDRIVEFSKTCRIARQVGLQKLIEEGRL